MTASWTDFTRADVDRLLENRFCYSPLKQNRIRLIKILPPQEGWDGLKTIELTMKTCDLHRQPLHKYSALSYAWNHEETPTRSKPHVGMNSMLDVGRHEPHDLDWKSRVSPEVERIADGSGGYLPAFWRAPNVVCCNGKFLPVSRTLYFALIRLRSLRRETKYWIDAICINQQDEKEKSSQIIIMGDIFSKAEKVIVWLGRARFPCRRFVDYLRELPEMHKDDHFALQSRGKAAHSFTKDHFEQARSYGANPSAPTGLETATYIYPLSEREHYRLKMYEEQAKHLTPFIWRPPNFGTHALNDIGEEFAHFFDEQWFHRTWPLQEMVLAQHLEFLWGPVNLSEDEMLRCVLWYNTRIVTRHVGSPTDMIYAFDARSEYQRSGPLGLLAALTLSRHRDCTRAEDKIFAVLGMAGQAAGLDVGSLAQRESDATDEVYVSSVYKEVATYLAQKVGVELLTLVGSRQAAVPLPSWVPYLRVDLWPTSIWHGHRERFQTIISGHYELHPLQVEGDSLRINGAHIDTISQALPGLSESGDTFQFAWIIRNLIDGLMPLVRYSRTGEPILRALWRTVLLGSSNLEQMGMGFVTWFLGQYKKWASVDCARAKNFEKIQNRTFCRKYSALELEPEYFEWLHKFINGCDSDHEPLLQQYKALRLERWFREKQFQDFFGPRNSPRKASKAGIDLELHDDERLSNREKLWYWKEDKLRSLSELPEKMSEKWTEFKDVWKLESELRQQEMHTTGQFAEPETAFYSLLGSSMRGRRLLVTRTGLLGLGPVNMEKGDTIVAIPGALVPFVVRKSRNGNHWSLVGEAYVHGIMEGEDVRDLGLKIEQMDIV